jgi:hypothetical protein
VIEKGKGKDKGKGNQGGNEEGDAILINLDMEEVLQFMQDELQLPNLKPKENNCLEDIKIKYNNISLLGPESLRHTRRTMLQALKRRCSTGEINELFKIPGFKDDVKLIVPINSDKRYRQYKEIKTPSSNALVIYARDGSGSMDQEKCDAISDMCWWIDIWIRRFYKRVEKMHVWHDVEAQEVSEDKFYKFRYGGGTICSSAFKFIAQQFENRFPPNKWNIFVLYFTDGDTWSTASPIGLPCFLDFANINSTTTPLLNGDGSISGVITIDTSYTKAVTEPFPNALVKLLNVSNETVAFAYTATDGSYSFANLPAGIYTVLVDAPYIPQLDQHTIPVTGNEQITGADLEVLTDG